MVCGAYGQANTGLSGPYVRGRRRGYVDGIDVIEFDLPYSNDQTFGRRSWVFAKYAWRSALLALQEKYDVIFATSTPLTSALPGILARWLRGKRFIFEVRDLWPELPRAMGVIRNPLVLGLMSMLEWTSYHSAHACIGLSPGMVDGIARRGIPLERIGMVPNGSDLDFFGAASAQPWRPDGVAAMDLLALFCGTHGIANGLDAVIDAAAELKRRGRMDIKIVLAGTGKSKAGLMSRAAAEGLSNVIFVPPLPKARLSGLMASADVGLMVLADVPAFYFGTSPNKFFDYLASGLPVLNNYPGWVANLIHENACGFVVPPRNAAAFADALVRMAADRDMLRQMGERARLLGRRDFDRTVLAERFVHIFETTARYG
jgi:glycosyltransferase involved in cell wall biosynthesis